MPEEDIEASGTEVANGSQPKYGAVNKTQGL